MNELYQASGPAQQGMPTNPQQQAYGEMRLIQQQAMQRAAALQQGAQSPDGNQALLDALNMGQIPPYANLKHLLLAN